jgi:hypothetical protein
MLIFSTILLLVLKWSWIVFFITLKYCIEEHDGYMIKLALNIKYSSFPPIRATQLLR